MSDEITDNGFARMLAIHRDGQTLTELATALQQLLQAVESTGKAGSLRLDLKVRPTGRGKSLAVVVVSDVSVKPPLPEPESTLFFVGERYVLTRDNPAQMALELKTVPEERPRDHPPGRRPLRAGGGTTLRGVGPSGPEAGPQTTDNGKESYA
jgi:hypothetical protein